MSVNTFEKEVVFTERAAAPVGAYSQAAKYGNLMFVSGQIPLNPESGQMETEFEAQVKQCLNNLKAIIEDGGSSMEKVIKVNIYLTDMAQFSVVNSIYTTCFSEPYPARAVVEVSGLPKGIAVEIEAVAGL